MNRGLGMSSEPLNDSTQLLRPRELARLLNVSASQVSRLIRQHALPFIVLNTSTRRVKGKEVTAQHGRFDKADVETCLRERRVEKS